MITQGNKDRKGPYGIPPQLFFFAQKHYVDHAVYVESPPQNGI